MYLSEDEEDRWNRRRRWPFFRGFYPDDFDEVFRQMDEIIQKEFDELTKKVPRTLIRERTLPDGSKVNEWGPFVYGYSVTIGPDGKPQIREFGNVKPEAKFGKPQLNIKEEREPLIDIIPTNGEIRVIAELPGVDKKDIKLHGTERSLTISVDVPQRKYYKEIDLPSKVDPKNAHSSYKNGVLEVTIKKIEEKHEGQPIQIE